MVQEDGLTGGLDGRSRREILAALTAGAGGALSGCSALNGGSSTNDEDEDEEDPSDGPTCQAPSGEMASALPSGGDYERDGDIYESDDPEQAEIQSLAFVSYEGPNGGYYVVNALEYSSPSAANEAVETATSGTDSVTGYVLVDEFVYAVTGPDEQRVRAFAKETPALSDECVAAKLAFTDSQQPEPTPDETDEQPPEDDTVDEVRIGMIQPLSGSLQAYGTIALRGFYTYFGYRGADIPREISEGIESFDVDGTTYEIDVRDSGGDQTEAQNQASDMAGNVSALAGGTSSASALAIANNVANQQGIPYMAGPTSSVHLTGSSDNCSRAVFRASETVAMDAQAGGRYLAEETDISSVYIYYADYSYGGSVKDNYQRVLEENGVRVAGTQALPQGYSSDWPAQFDQAVDAGVDAAIGGFTVATLPAMLSTYLANDYDFRMVGSLGTRLSCAAYGATLRDMLEELTEQAIEEAGAGPFTTRYHWNQYDNAIARNANTVHRDVYGANTDLFTAGMFTSASAIVQAAESTGSASSADITDALTGMTVEETLKGRDGYRFQEYNNQARSAMSVVDLTPTEDQEYWNASVRPSEPLATYGMDETTLDSELVSCSLD